MDSRSDHSLEKPLIYESVSQHDSTNSPVDSSSDNEALLYRQGRSNRHWRSYLKYSAIIGILLFLYSSLLVTLTVNVTSKNRRIGPRFVKTPVDPKSIVYEAHVMEQWVDQGGGSPVTYFSNQPNEQVDKNWHELFQYQNIGVEPGTYERMGREDEGIKLPDGTYYGSIMVFHHLHCLKNLYHALHPEYYGLDNLTVETQASWKDHTTHCLHMLKEALMCQGDTTVLTMM
ncbi:hypothetical protein BO71DRAFT_429897 [Aspergillus ellipticus CBS 707.79]|uniref:Tat pathway signal sequence n=1 Tax=Aspergillus ellipticus CBS 707.79 TaxID=1448320 RepID=A0A319DTD1_9EURO|nr:hypothetical protein BO71DRAFT_429897 [Aspergillus ellipticus CBS 707.79]